MSVQASPVPAMPPIPPGDAELAKSRFRDAVSEYDRLCVVQDPEDEPYKSKYAAREVLTQFIAAVEASASSNPTTREAVKWLVVSCKRRLGVNFILTEENQAGHDTLSSVIAELQPVTAPDAAQAVSTVDQLMQHLDKAIDVLYACNFQCLLLSGWGKHNSCLRRLRLAKAVYSSTMAALLRTLEASHTSVPPLIVSAQFPKLSVFVLPESLPTLLQAPVETVHALFTHTLFYCAQTFGSVHRPDKSAAYVEATLQRQLDLCEGVRRRPVAAVTNEYEQLADVNEVEWAKNALRLSEYFVTNFQWQHAVYCLTASDIMFKRISAPEPDSPELESYKRLCGESSSHWGKLYATMLRVAFESARAKDLGLPPPAMTPQAPQRLSREELVARRVSKRDGGTTGDSCDEEASQSSMDEADSASSSPKTFDLPFRSLVTNATGVPLLKIESVDCLDNFEACRGVFKKALAHFQKALEVFVLDGYVTDHCGILSLVGRLYKHLSLWEPDSKRKIAMHQRRIDTLAPLLDVLNPNVFQVILKETSLDVAQAANEAVELRYARVSAAASAGKPSVAEADKLSGEVGKAIGYFAFFIRCYKDARCERPLQVVARHYPAIPDEPMIGATYLDDGSREAYLTALFSIARLFGKDTRRDPSQRLEAMKASLDQFRVVKRIAAAILEPGSDIFRDELKAVEEFLVLLPPKIDSFRYRGKDLM